MWGEFAKSILRSLTDLPRRKRRAALAAVDLLLLSLLVWVLTAWRYGELQPFEAWQQVVLTFVGPVLTVVTFLLLRVYHMVARYIGPGGALRLSGFVVLSTLAWSALLLFAGQLGVPRSVIFLYAILGSAVAVAVRLLAASMLRTVGIHLERTSKLKRAMPVLIYGTGELAVQLSRALKLSKTRALAGYIDDSFAMIGRRIYGAKIYRPDRIPMLVQEFGVEEIILAVEKQTLAERQALLRQLEDYRIRVRIVPDLEDIAIGRVQLKDLRGVEGRDLLGREEVQPDPMLLGAAINGKSILVTGAGGSIGSQLARQIAELEPKRLVLLDHSLCVGLRYVAEVAEGHARAASPGFPRHIISDALQQPQNSVLRLEAGTSVGRDACLHETAPHHLDVRGGVAVGCGDLGVSEPGLDR